MSRLMTVQIPEEYIEELKRLAEEESWGDSIADPDSESYVDEFAGGNVDDAYYGGVVTGEIDKAREILSKIVLPTFG